MRRVVLSLLMLMVLLPSAAFARTEYLCAMDGESRSACCCPASEGNRDDDSGPAIQRSCCCEVTTVAAAESAAYDPPKSSVPTHHELVAVVVAPPLDAAFVRVSRSVEQRALAPPFSGSLFARRCALLL